MQHFSRREILKQYGAGFPMLGLATALQSAGNLAAASPSSAVHMAPRAKRVIFLFMNGGPSHVDTFDPKPMLEKYAGQSPSDKKYKQGNASSGFMPSPFRFAPQGESGVVMSELFPHLAERADDLCVIRSMYTDTPNHEPGLLLMHAGIQQPTRPSLGSWVSYGLGSENQNLPSFVVLSPGLPVIGPQLWSNSFLPAQHQGMAVDTNDMEVEKLLPNLRHPTIDRPQQRDMLDTLNEINQIHLNGHAEAGTLEAQIRSMEMAYNMQAAAGEAFDISHEPAHVKKRYGNTLFGRSCLLARRLAEAGVRFVQVYSINRKGKQPWDTHQNNDRRHRELCTESDQATAALIGDLKERGLLDDTLVIWGGEFGRTPYSQIQKKKSKKSPPPGRDHHNHGFSMFLAGGGVQGGLMHGKTDELGLDAIDNRVHVHDLHATLLHLLGIDHTRLTYRYSGRDFRLTDVHGQVVHDILA